MILFYHNTEKATQERLILALHQGYDGEKMLIPTKNFDPEDEILDKADCIVFSGMIRGDGLIYRYCLSNNKRYLYVDHAYLYPGYHSIDSSKEWMRITDSSFLWNKMEPRPSDRYDQFFKDSYDLMPWNLQKDKPNVLILPPSNGSKYLFPECSSWLDKTFKELAMLGKNIVIREKPLQVIVDVDNRVIDKVVIEHDKTVEEELAYACVVAAYNSAVAVKATIMGIPIYASELTAAGPMSFRTIADLRDAAEPPRREWINQLAYHQFTRREMEQGRVFKILGIIK